jgi:drug/metabolite transporter (DMT)-like permease
MSDGESGSRPALGAALGLFGILIFSGTLPATRLAVPGFDPIFLTFARAAIAALAAALCLIALRRPLPRPHIVPLLLVALTMIYGFPGFVAVAMLTVPSAHGGVILGILPLTTAICAVILAGERPSPLFWISGVAGAITITVFAFRDGGELGFVLGDLWLLVAAVIASLGYVISGKLTAFMPGWEVICWALVLTAPVALGGTVLLFDTAYLELDAQHAAALAYLGLGSMFLGFFFFNAGMKLSSISQISQLLLLQTFFTLALAWAVLGENITWETMGFATIVLALVVIGRWARIGRV